MRNVESYLELLYSYTHNAIQLHLSFEIGPFEDQGADFVEIPHLIESVDEFWVVRFRTEIWSLAVDISELSEPLELILHSFVVVTSTIEL